MARLVPARRSELLCKVNKGYAIGVRANIETIRLSTMLICLQNLGLGPRPGQYVAFSHYGKPIFM
jgi:hypothetical protein